jgi:hypothetical protein
MARELRVRLRVVALAVVAAAVAGAWLASLHYSVAIAAARTRPLAAGGGGGRAAVATPMPRVNGGGRSFVFAVLTMGKYHATRLGAIMETWGKHADIRVIASDHADARYPLVESMPFVGKKYLGRKVMHTWARMCAHSADFHVMTDDDTFVVIPNFEAAFAAADPAEHLYTGYMLAHSGMEFIGGGGGIVLSNRTMAALCAAQRRNATSQCGAGGVTRFAGDTAMWHCMRELGVPASHTDGFYPYSPDVMLAPFTRVCSRRTLWWISEHLKCPPIAAAISFHYVPYQAFRGMYYWTHYFVRRPSARHVGAMTMTDGPRPPPATHAPAEQRALDELNKPFLAAHEQWMEDHRANATRLNEEREMRRVNKLLGRA